MRILIPCLLAASLMIGACNGGDDDEKNTNNTDPDIGVDAKKDDKDATTVDDTNTKPDIQPDKTVKPDTTEPDLGVGAQVTSSHTGWKNPDCAGCHDDKTAKNAHGTDYEVPKCVECHGYNGAPHKSHAGGGSCSGCHPNEHNLGFSASDCSTCHYQQ